MSSPNSITISTNKKMRIIAIRIVRKWPLLVWIGMVWFVYYAWQITQQPQSFPGFMVKNAVQIASMETGKITEIAVETGQTVSKNDILAKIDTTLIESEILATETILEQEQQTEYRQYINALQRMQSELRDLQLRQAQDTAENAVLAQENKRLEALLSKHLVDADMVARNRAQLAAISEAVLVYPTLMEQLESDINLLIETQGNTSTFLGKTQQRASQTDKDPRLLYLEKRKEQFQIKAQSNGVIAVVYKSPGDVVSEGDVILELIPHNRGEAVVLLPESVCRQFQPGQTVYITASLLQQDWHQAKVRSLSPRMVSVPDRSSPIPNRSIRGRYMMLDIGSSDTFLANESILVSAGKPNETNNFFKKISEYLF